MDLTQYKQMLMLFPEKPDLNKLGDEDKIPEGWPLVIKTVDDSSKDLLNFEITDSKTTLSCQVKDVEMIEKVVSMKSGQIVFLYDSKISKNEDLSDLLVDTGFVYTLKEVNDGLAEPVKKKEVVAKKAPRKIVIRKNVAQTARRTSSTRQEQDSRWRTLSERWQKQGKI